MICCADLHIRKSRPRCRKDDYIAAQDRKFRFILEQARQSPPLVVAGDFFHHPKPGEELLAWVINLLRQYNVRPMVIPGQHDLPGHSLEQIHRSGLGVLAAAGVIELIGDEFCWAIPKFGLTIMGISYGAEPLNIDFRADGTDHNVLLWHHMVINEVPIWPGQVVDKAHSLLRKYPQFDLIVTGDNHESFAVAETADLAKAVAEGVAPRWLINPGSMMRMTAAQVDHKPCVYEWDNGKVIRHLLPIEDDVFDLTELERAKGKDARIQAFVDGLEGQWEIGRLFQENLSRHFEANVVARPVRDRLWRWTEE